MIQLNPDYLIFQTSNGENIPCSAELVTIELIGEAVEFLEPDLVRNASAAVLHYFKNELGKNFVTVAEFSEALEKVLRGFGLTVKSSETEAEPNAKPGSRVCETDLCELAASAGKGFELIFFASLRDHLRQELNSSAEILRFKGLRGCVKQLTGSQRWCGRCQILNDQIVEYLRGCMSAESKKNSCSLVVW
ncbi:MAG: hypothetical protein H0X66_03885 [Verrucomicrobia bacterium]|jgi:hypothetical protein|nr:hypothetical protein [Verrucomicrobiota bacterium]